MIDGILACASLGLHPALGSIFRNYFDKPVVNGFGDVVGEGTKKIGRTIKVIQTGRIQQYLLMALILAFGAMFYVVYTFLRP